jgi:hypothetical protein
VCCKDRALAESPAELPMKTPACFLPVLLALPAAFASDLPLQLWTQTGYVAYVNGSGWDDSVTPGSPFSATMLFYSSSSQSYPPEAAEAQYTDVLVSASAAFGNYVFEFTVPYPGFPPAIRVIDNETLRVPVDGYGWYWQTPVAQNGMVVPMLQGMLLSSDLSLLNSHDFCVQGFPISRFDEQARGQLGGYDSLNNYWSVEFFLTDYSITAIPEPGHGILFAGWLALAIRSSRAGSSSRVFRRLDLLLRRNGPASGG